MPNCYYNPCLRALTPDGYSCFDLLCKSYKIYMRILMVAILLAMTGPATSVQN